MTAQSYPTWRLVVFIHDRGLTNNAYFLHYYSHRDDDLLFPSICGRRSSVFRLGLIRLCRIAAWSIKLLTFVRDELNNSMLDKSCASIDSSGPATGRESKLSIRYVLLSSVCGWGSVRKRASQLANLIEVPIQRLFEALDRPLCLAKC